MPYTAGKRCAMCAMWTDTEGDHVGWHYASLQSEEPKVEEIHAHPLSREKRYNSVEIEIAIGTWHIWKM